MRPLLVYDIEITYHKSMSICICLILFKSSYKLLEYIFKVRRREIVELEHTLILHHS